MISFKTIPKFDKNLKHLLKKYDSLNEDISILKKVLEILPKERPPFSFRINNIASLKLIIKIKKIACKSLMGKGANSGLRIIYEYNIVEDIIVLIQIYHKGENATEDRDRIINYCKQ
jgi:mRNA-degrading endonuclease RelE of RelBE toxin-antitoxin system